MVSSSQNYLISLAKLFQSHCLLVNVSSHIYPISLPCQGKYETKYYYDMNRPQSSSQGSGAEKLTTHNIPKGYKTLRGQRTTLGDQTLSQGSFHCPKPTTACMTRLGCHYRPLATCTTVYPCGYSPKSPIHRVQSRPTSKLLPITFHNDK